MLPSQCYLYDGTKHKKTGPVEEPVYLKNIVKLLN